MKPQNPCVVLTGPSGSGKSSILRFLEKSMGAQVAPKYTTRPSRGTEEDERDFIFCNEDQFPKDGVMRFPSYGHLFGIELEQIGESLRRGELHAIIVGDYAAVRQMSALYGDQLLVILVFCSSTVLKERIFRDVKSHRVSRWVLVQEELSGIYDNLDCVTNVVNNSGSFEHSCERVYDIVSRFGRHT